MENHRAINKEQISTNLEKKTWVMPELVVIDKNVIEGGNPTGYEFSNSGSFS